MSKSSLLVFPAIIGTLLLVGCAAVEPPPLTAGHPASTQTAEGARPILPPLRADELTRGTQRRLAGGDTGADTMQHGGNMEGMDHSKMKEMNQPKKEEMDHSKMEGMGPNTGASAKANPPGSDTAPAAYYTCPMHEEIKQAQPGKCPICGMTLVKKATAEQYEKMEEKR